MTAKDLKALLKNVPDSTLIVVKETDIEYRDNVEARFTTALEGEGLVYKDLGDDSKLDPSDNRVRVIVID